MCTHDHGAQAIDQIEIELQKQKSKRIISKRKQLNFNPRDTRGRKYQNLISRMRLQQTLNEQNNISSIVIQPEDNKSQKTQNLSQTSIDQEINPIQSQPFRIEDSAEQDLIKLSKRPLSIQKDHSRKSSENIPNELEIKKLIKSEITNTVSKHNQLMPKVIHRRLSIVNKNLNFEAQYRKRNRNRRISMVANCRNSVNQFIGQNPKTKMLQRIRDNLIEEQKLSVAHLRHHILDNHSKKIETPLCEIQISFDDFLSLNDKEREIPEFIKDIGCGPSMYLLFLKALSKLFWLLTVLNIPIMFIYASGTESQDLSGIAKLFGQFSIGNIGESGLKCKSLTILENQDSIYINCNSGKLSKIVSVGIAKNNEQICDTREIKNEQREYKNTTLYNFFDYTTACSSFVNNDFKESKFIQTLKSSFDKDCIDQHNCTLQASIENSNKECWEEVENRLKKQSEIRNNNKIVNHHNHQQIKECDETRSGTGNDAYRGCLSTTRNGKQCQAWKTYNEGGNALKGTDGSHNYCRNPNGKDTIWCYTEDNETSWEYCDDQDPKLQIMYICESTPVKLMFTETLIQKKTILAIALANDLISITILIGFLSCLEWIIRDFAQKFDDQCVEMKDFAIRTDQLPQSYSKYKDEISMKFAIWKLIQEKIEDLNNSQIESVPNDLDPSVVEINFGLKSCENLNVLKRIEHTNQKIELRNIQLSKCKSKPEVLFQTKMIEQLRKKLQRQVTYYEKTYKTANIYQATNLDNESFYDQIQQVYITFMSMETKSFALNWLFREDGKIPKKLDQYYQNTKYQNKTKQINKVGNVWKNTIQALEQGSQFQQPIKIKKDVLWNTENIQFEKEKEKDISQTESIQEFKAFTPVDPEYILWKNIGYSKLSKRLRRIFSIIIVILIVLISFWIIIALNQMTKSEYKNINTQTCQDPSITKQTAQKQVISGQIQDTNHLACYCYNQLLLHPGNYSSIEFDIYDEGKLTKENSCYEWLKDFTKENLQTFAQSFSITLVNITAAFIFVKVSENEKHHNIGNENMMVFRFIFIEAFTNTGLNPVLQDKTFWKYQSIDSQWFTDLGSFICFASFMEIFISKGGDCAIISLTKIKQWYDRGFRAQISSGDDDIPFTRKYKQHDLQVLYTGEQILIGKKFAQMFEFIFIGLTYSAGIPILYPIVAVFFQFTYYFDMISILKYYMKTNVFSEELPIKSLDLFKYGIILHLLFLIVIIVKSEICRTTHFEGEHFSQIKTNVNYIENLYSLPMIIVYGYILLCVIYYIYRQYFNDPFVVLGKMWIERMQKVNQNLIRNQITLKRNMKKLSTFIMKKNEVDLNNSSSDEFQKKQNLENSTISANEKKVEDQPPDKRKMSFSNHLMSVEELDEEIESGFFFKSGKSFQAENTNDVVSQNYYGELFFDFLEINYEHTLILLMKLMRRYLKMKSQLDQNKLKPQWLQQNNVDEEEELKMFQKYIMSVKQNKHKIEQQIDFYYNYHLENDLEECKDHDHINDHIKQSKSYSSCDDIISSHSSYCDSKNSKQKEGGSDEPQSLLSAGDITSSQCSSSKNLSSSSTIKSETDENIVSIAQLNLKENEQEYFEKLDYMNLNYDELQLRTKKYKNNLRLISFTQSYNIMYNQEFYHLDESLQRAQTLLSYPIINLEEQ